jgi:hypothetical protein
MERVVTRSIASGRFCLSLPAREAIGLFTPEGERSWAPGWRPAYPAGRPSETPGTVFITTADGLDTIWVLHAIDLDRHTAEYARVTPRCHAGTVRISCADTSAGGCVVSVVYDLTLLPGGDPKTLDAYGDASFETMMSRWSEAIRSSL